MISNSGLYRIVCNDSDGFYVGASKNLRLRKSQHWTHLKSGVHTCKPLQGLCNTYGLKSLRFVVMEYVPESLDLAEKVARLADLEEKALRSFDPGRRLNKTSISYTVRGTGKTSAKDMLNEFRRVCHKKGVAFRDALEEALRPFIHGKSGRPVLKN